MSDLHPLTRKFGARYLVTKHRHIPADLAELVRTNLEQDITACMQKEGYRSIGAVKHYVAEREHGFEYRAIQLGLPLDVNP
jgi:hypothetical protein